MHLSWSTGSAHLFLGTGSACAFMWGRADGPGASIRVLMLLVVRG